MTVLRIALTQFLAIYFYVMAEYFLFSIPFKYINNVWCYFLCVGVVGFIFFTQH